MLLTRDAILEADDLPTEDVECPEWGGTVRVRTMTGEERDKFESSLINVTRKGKKTEVKQQMENVRARLVSLCAVNEQGERLFSDQDVAALGRKSAAALDRVYAVAQRLNQVSDEDVEELAGN